MSHSFRSAADLAQHIEKHGMKFSGALDLSGCTALAALPDGLSVGGGLRLPDHLCGDRVWRGEPVTLRNIDDYTMVIERSYRTGEAEVWRARYFNGRKVADMKRCFVAKLGEHHAHGDTIEEAIEDAREKALEAASAAEVLNAIRARGFVSQAEFRAVTGACRAGLRHGMEERGLDPAADEVPLADALRLARGNSFGERFIAMVNSKGVAK